MARRRRPHEALPASLPAIWAADNTNVIRLCGDAAPLEIQAADGQTRKVPTFQMTAYTGVPMQVAGYYHPVVADLDGMTFASPTLPVLMSHDPARIVGHSEQVTKNTRGIKASGVISGVGEDAQQVLALSANGFPWRTSIGASVERIEFCEAGAKIKANGRTYDGPVYVARATTLREISFVSIGADGNTSATVAASYPGASVMTFEQWLAARGIDAATLTDSVRTALQAAHKAETTPVPIATLTTPPTPAPAPAVTPPVQAASPPALPDPAVELRGAAVRELARQGELRRIHAQYPNLTIEIGEGEARQTVDLYAHAIEQNWDTQRYELEALRRDRPSGPRMISRSHDRDCTIQALQGAMVLRAGGRLDHPAYQSPRAIAMGLPQWLRAGLNTDQRQRAMEAAHRYADLSAVDLCREALRLDQRDVPHARNEAIRAAFSGSALTNIFTTNVNAILLSTYMEAGDTTGGWTRESDVADFKTNERPRMAKGPALKRLPRGAEADHLSRSDSAESFKIARYAKQFVIDEQDMIDDSLGAFANVPVEMGLAAARLRPDLVYAILLRNAALGADSIALFHASHSNLNTSAALSSAKLQAAIAAMEKMQENGVNLNLRATHLIVPSDLKHTGAELIKSSTILLGADDESVRGSLNTIAAIESLTLVSDARLSNGVTDPVDDSTQSGSTSTWYIASSMGHNIEVAYLRGTGRAPQVRSFVLSEGKWGMGWDVNMDIGAKSLDYRGMQKNTA